jgi:hypothetical protein
MMLLEGSLLADEQDHIPRSSAAVDRTYRHKGAIFALRHTALGRLSIQLDFNRNGKWVAFIAHRLIERARLETVYWACAHEAASARCHAFG